jgi:hypothetical protein
MFEFSQVVFGLYDAVYLSASGLLSYVKITKELKKQI